jgi:isopentenyl-diphosphate delta-isomerase
MKDTKLPKRKNEHLKINLVKDVQSSISNGFENFRFQNNSLPELSLNSISTETTFLGKKLNYPILISSITGGTSQAAEINRILARAAESNRLAIGVGSQRAMIEDPSLLTTFSVRRYAPTTLVFANLGAVQLNYGLSNKDFQNAVELIEADALILHLNALQEALQPEGQTNFSGLLKKIEALIKVISVPVIIKEIGWGVSSDLAKRLLCIGVACIDIAGAGGTSWSQVERYRSNDPMMQEIASRFRDWGIPTADAIFEIKKLFPECLLIASGGITNGLEIAKSIALGASICGIAGPFLKAAVAGEDKLQQFIEYLVKELRISMFATGCGSIDQLSRTSLQKVS